MIQVLATLLASGLAAATPAESAQQALTTAGQALARCVGDGVAQADVDLSPETVADVVLELCRPNIDAFAAAQESWIAASDMSETEKTNARQAFQSRMANARGNLIRGITAARQGP